MTLTIWSNGGRHEFLIRNEAGEIVVRSGLVYSNRAAAKRAAMKAYEAL